MASNRSLVLRTQRYKYISPSQGSPMITWGPKIETGYSPTPQLYDLSRSPYENENIAEKKPRKLHELQALLEALRTNASPQK